MAGKVWVQASCPKGLAVAGEFSLYLGGMKIHG